MKNFLLFLALCLFQSATAQTYELHKSINFDPVDGSVVPDGITWYLPVPLSYGIYKTAGAWSPPNYQQLKIAFDTGIIIDGGSAYGKSGTILQPNGGYVGIGTSSADAPLTVYGNSNFYPARIGSGDSRLLEISQVASFPTFINNDYPLFLKTGGGNQPLILDAARIGVGTTNPQSALDVAGFISTFGGPNSTNNYSSWGIGNGSWDNRPNNNSPYIIQNHTGLTFNAHSNYGGIRFYDQGYPNLYSSTLVMSVVNNRVGIGTTTPDEALAVNGTIHSKEVRVDLVGWPSWPDYVFEKHFTGNTTLKPGYSLLTLKEIEAYTKANHHLPEVPSAAEVATNGLKLGEMNRVLLQKIEELTLYAIEQDKKQTALEKEIAELKQLYLALKK